MKRKNSCSWVNLLQAFLLPVGGIVFAANAELPMDFQPSASPLAVMVQCMPGVSYNANSCVRKSSSTDPDITPFFMETVMDAGIGYYHILLGDPNGSFAQEYYIGYAGGLSWYSGYRMTASAGSYNGGSDASHNGGTTTYYDPLDSDPLKSGNATGNPNRTIFRQTIKGATFNQEIVKQFYLKQPIITQEINDIGITSSFGIDMSANSYTAMSAVSGVISNTVFVSDPDTGFVVTDFDIQTDSQNSQVSGGLFTYTNGPAVGGSFGTYTYASGAFDVYAIDWKALSDQLNVP